EARSGSALTQAAMRPMYRSDARTSEPTVANGTAFFDDRTCPAITGTISKPWYVNIAVSAARAQEISTRPAALKGEGAAPENPTNARTSASRGRSFSTVSVVQPTAEIEMPEPTTSASPVTSPAFARRSAASLSRPKNGATALTSPTITAEAERIALT